MNRYLTGTMAALIMGASALAGAGPAAAHDHHGYGGGGYGYEHHGDGNGVGLAIAGGLLGLAVGAALAGHSNSGGQYGDYYEGPSPYSEYGGYPYSQYGRSYGGSYGGSYGDQSYYESDRYERQCIRRTQIWDGYRDRYVVRQVRYAC